MFRLLVCLDRSDFSRAVFPAAKKLIEATRAEVEIVSVVEADRPFGEPWSGRARDIAADAMSKRVEEQRRFLEPIAADFDPPADITVLVDSSPARAILGEARRWHADVIALATHSRGAMGEAALGSTARELARAGAAPVLLVHSPALQGMRAADIPAGIFTFTSDGEPVGQVVEVGHDRIRIRWAAGEEFELPVGAPGAVTTGQLVLTVTRADLPLVALESSI
jgi:nucleotide-binding universal stress UspA family protein